MYTAIRLLHVKIGLKLPSEKIDIALLMCPVSFFGDTEFPSLYIQYYRVKPSECAHNQHCFKRRREVQENTGRDAIMPNF